MIHRSCLIITLLLPFGTLAQTGDLAAASSEKLQKASIRVDETALGIERAFVEAVKAAELPGGLEIFKDCRTPSPRVTVTTGSPASFVLAEIIAARPDLSVSIEATGVVRVIPRTPHKTILDIKLGDVKISEKQNVVVAVRSVLNTPEVQAEMRRLKIQEKPTQLGFGTVPRPGSSFYAGPNWNASGTTVRETLEKLAILSGRAVWVYVEEVCEGQRRFSLDFAVR